MISKAVFDIIDTRVKPDEVPCNQWFFVWFTDNMITMAYVPFGTPDEILYYKDKGGLIQIAWVYVYGICLIEPLPYTDRNPLFKFGTFNDI